MMILTYLAICYLAGFAAVCADPYWEDNGGREFIPMRGRWGWAALLAGFFEIILSPALWAMSWIRHRRYQATPQPKV
jgi:hypothetical protein